MARGPDDDDTTYFCSSAGSLLCYIVLAVCAYLVECLHRCSQCCHPRDPGGRANYARSTNHTASHANHPIIIHSSDPDAGEHLRKLMRRFKATKMHFHQPVTIFVNPEGGTFAQGYESAMREIHYWLAGYWNRAEEEAEQDRYEEG